MREWEEMGMQKAIHDHLYRSSMNRWFVIVMPRILIVVTRLMPGIGGGRM